MMEIVFEMRKRTLLGNEVEDQFWRAFHVREARARMN